MRADRLVATLLLLQTRGRVTAAEVAGELEVSERTARRDLEALSMSGVPVYSQQGRGGGWSLVGGARTDLSGLNAAEARALFLVAGPSSAATPEVRAALRKLVRALPETFRADAEAAAHAVVVDPVAWGGTTAQQPEFLDALQRAVVDGVQVRLDYAARDRAHTTRVVHPLGLVIKGTVWYLMADTAAGMRTFRVSRVRAVERTDDLAVRPDGFDLGELWRSIAAEIDDRRIAAWATALTERGAVGWLRAMYGANLVVGGPTPDGRIEIRIGGRSSDSLARSLAGFGDQIEVIAPVEIRDALQRIGGELLATYGAVADRASVRA
jgi:predicted DNA-binding transcriptional regulator YafY